ncbi:RsmB/NOP family class I SAM-dependent RNA methyltransferase [Luteococcus sp. Sow4_B9]|uniref:RsmB/NOP family class I SAM-dependent RNA methyltransferase n=1 Tax=Luteococcus sp. Sow4_B9 TaxID=3438792 RepID=UPI003F98BB0A
MSPRDVRRPPERFIDLARMAAFDTLRDVHASDAYANLALAEQQREHDLNAQEAALCTELVNGTCRWEGTYDRIIEAAGGRALGTLQPAIVDVLRLGTHQLLGMRTPTHAAVSTSVDLAGIALGERTTGVVNAIIRKVAQKSLDEWLDELTAGMGERGALALRTGHPRWIVDAWAAVLPDDELEAALLADNEPPVPTLVVRPGLAERDELLTDGGRPTEYSPHGVVREGNPAQLAAVRQRRAGVQDEGSQLVALALTRVDAPAGRWLDLCAGPGGKAALLAGLAGQQGSTLLANEAHQHRAELVRKALMGYPVNTWQVQTGDGTRPSWEPGSFTRVMADVPCSGLGSLRRRPESRWRRTPEDVHELHELQAALLDSAITSTAPGGVLAYVTCSPHRAETAAIVQQVADERVEILDAPSFLTEVPDCRALTDERFVQLWPHRHGTDAMFLVLMRRRQD